MLALAGSTIVLLGGCGAMGGGEPSINLPSEPGGVSADPNAPGEMPAGATLEPTTAPGGPPVGEGGTPGAATDPATGLPVGSGAGVGAGSTGSSPTDAAAKAGEMVRTSNATPAQFTDALGKRTIVVYFYQPGSSADEVMLGEVRKALAGHKEVTYLQYTPADWETYGDLPEKLGLFGLPAVAVVNRSGELQNFKLVYWPANLIARAIRLANAAKPSSTTNDDAPTPSNGFEALADPSAATTTGTTAAATGTAAPAGTAASTSTTTAGGWGSTTPAPASTPATPVGSS